MRDDEYNPLGKPPMRIGCIPALVILTAVALVVLGMTIAR